MSTTLSTTAYAVLGLLAVRPMTPYELTQQMQRSLDYCWPTSERSLYDQPERLVAAGYAEVVDRAADGPRRYAATDAGRTALRAWLAIDTAMPKFQNEPLLRVLFADQGTVADLHRVLRALRTHTEERRRAGVAQLETYLAGDGMFQDRAHIVTIVGDLIARVLAVLGEWAADVEALTAEWESTTGHGGAPEIQQLLRDLIERESTRLTPT